MPLAELLKHCDRATERAILEQLELAEPKIAAELKKRMFVFENIAELDDRATQRVLREVEPNDMALALKAAPEEVAQKILRSEPAVLLAVRVADLRGWSRRAFGSAASSLTIRSIGEARRSSRLC